MGASVGGPVLGHEVLCVRVLPAIGLLSESPVAGKGCAEGRICCHGSCTLWTLTWQPHVAPGKLRRSPQPQFLS